MNPNSLLLLGALIMVIVALIIDLTVRMRHGRIR
jgi:ABC-type proline/glycine betaine transport system permease subunit